MDKNWLIRTTSKQILGPVSKQKILELIEKGSISGDDEICSGNGYWFKICENELVELYVYGEKKQPFNPISEADSYFHKQSQLKIEQLAPVEKLNPNIPTAPKENFELDLEIDSKIDISLEKLEQDTGLKKNNSVMSQQHIEDESAQDITVVETNLLKKVEQAPETPPPSKESDGGVVLPNAEDLDFPDVGDTPGPVPEPSSGLELDVSDFAPPPKAPPISPVDNESVEDTPLKGEVFKEMPIEYPKMEISQDLDSTPEVGPQEVQRPVGEETIDGYKLPANEDLEYPDFGEEPPQGKASAFDDEFQIEQADDIDDITTIDNSLKAPSLELVSEDDDEIDEEEEEKKKKVEYESTMISNLVTDDSKNKIEILEHDDFEDKKKIDKKLIMIVLGTFVFGIICALLVFKFVLSWNKAGLQFLVPSAYAQNATENFVKKKVSLKKKNTL